MTAPDSSASCPQGRTANTAGALGALADHDARSLASWLAHRTGKPLTTARRAANKTLRHAFGSCGAPGRWTDQALRAEAIVGRWARPHLLELSPLPVLRLAEWVRSADGTVRMLWRAADDELTESVIIPTGLSQPRPRTTVCVSSQVGCARGCRFCESGRFGLTRQLSPAEIVDQYRLSADWWRHHGGAPISNIVFMGMGEPLDNLPAVTTAIRLLCDQHTFGVTPSRITVSTVGVIDKLDAFFESTRAELALTLGAPDDARRRRIIPIAARYDLASLRERLLAVLPQRRRVLFQYALFRDFNDALADADRLAEYVGPVRCRVNVLSANRGPDPSLVAPPPERVRAFAERLAQRGVRTIVRASRGTDVGGACGQLAGAHRPAAATTTQPRRSCDGPRDDSLVPSSASRKE